MNNNVRNVQSVRFEPVCLSSFRLPLDYPGLHRLISIGQNYSDQTGCSEYIETRIKPCELSALPCNDATKYLMYKPIIRESDALFSGPSDSFSSDHPSNQILRKLQE
jgi:hypothetical protein